ncbi:MAG: hypothetical protein WC301_07115 [Candidatus Omnitrophota bacterium]|jgi:hypothetical protein
MILLRKRIIRVLLIIFSGLVFSLYGQHACEAAAQDDKAGGITEYKSGGLRDPFQQDVVEIIEPEIQAEPRPLPLLEVQGMVWGGRMPQAIINNKVVKIGDMIEGVRIAAIDKGGIVVFFDNQPHTLSVPVKKGLSEPIEDQNT